MRNIPVPQWVTHRLVVIRTAAILAAAALFFGASTQPASAAGVDRCTTTNMVSGLVRLIGQNVVNPIREYGWVLFIVALVITVVLAAFTNGAGRGWKAVFWIFVLMTVVIGLVGPAGAFSFDGSGTTGC